MVRNLPTRENQLFLFPKGKSRHIEKKPPVHMFSGLKEA